MALDSIAAHKFRSALTIIGIVVGIVTAVVVASILTGMRQSIVSIVEEYGTNNIYAFHLSMGEGPGNRDERNRKPLTDADADAILAQSTAIEDIALSNPGIGNFGPSFDDNMTYEDVTIVERRWMGFRPISTRSSISRCARDAGSPRLITCSGAKSS